MNDRINETSRFIMTSHGWSGSRWMGYTLEQHEDITCSHSAKNLHAKHGDYSHKNLKNDIQQFHKGYKNRQDIPIEENYEEIMSYGNTKYYGSVHLYRLRDLPHLHDKFGDFHDNYHVMNLVRHPVPLVWSGYGEFRSLFKFDINDLYWTLHKILNAGKEFVFDLAKKHNLILGDIEVLSFIGACAVLGSLQKDVKAEKLVKELPNISFHGHVKMEEVTSKPEVLKNLLLKLTNNEINIEEVFLEKSCKRKALNKHRSDKKILTPKERFFELEEWQKECFIYFFDYYNIESFYSKLGYDFSFVTR